MRDVDLQRRTKQFALRIIKLAQALPKNAVGKTICNQILRSGMSVGANYRAALHGRSKAEFTAKLGTVFEEADECCYWLELITEAGLMEPRRTKELHAEACELTSIFASALKKCRKG